MLRRIGVRFVIGVSGVVATTIGLLALPILNAHESDRTAEVYRSAERLSETIKRSAHNDMLENRRSSLHRQIEAVGHQEGIEVVRVFNKAGRIMFSSNAAEMGLTVNKRAEACTACHAEGEPIEKLPTSARSRIFRAKDGHRVLGIINPIQNQPGCVAGACHAHKASSQVLGVLDVALSLREVDRDMERSRARLVGLGLAAIVTCSLFAWWINRRLVLRPVEALAEATRKVTEGDLTATIPVTARHEIGDLARAFNVMVKRVAESRAQLTQAEKLASIGRLAAGVAHEINNPLTGVLTYASFLQKRCDEKPEWREDLDVIVRETKRCREIVRGLLEFSRQTPPKRQPTQIGEVVERAVAITANQLALSRVKLEVRLARDLPAVLADGNQIEQVLVNLLLNAADAVPRDTGRIELMTGRVNSGTDAVEVRVSDNGRGIRQADLPRIFEPFFTTKSAKGTGLGLAVSWGIVQAHGGKLEVESSDGKGTTFSVRLPVQAARSASNTETKP